MRQDQSERIDEAHESDPVDFEAFAGYQDGDAYVVCDRSEATAWIRSDVTTEIER